MISLFDVGYQTNQFQLHINQLQFRTGLTLLVGRNGSGKSTLLKLLATACKPDRGQIRYDGIEAVSHLHLIRGQIGYVPSHVEMYGDMTPVQFLQYFAHLKGISKDELGNPAAYWIRRLHIEPYQHKKLKKCSLGMQHRVLFAQALLAQPRYILLDEPLNYLDQKERERMMDVLSHLAENSCIVVVSHELNEWSEIAHRIVWLDQGEVRFAGSPQQWIDPCKGKVWSGTADAEDMTRLVSIRSDGEILSVRAAGEQMKVIWMGDKAPMIGFERKMPDWEEAYLVRHRRPIDSYPI